MSIKIKLNNKVIIAVLLATITFNTAVVSVNAVENSVKNINSTMIATKIEAPEAGSSATPSPSSDLEATSSATSSADSAEEVETIEFITDKDEVAVENKSFFTQIREKIASFMQKLKFWKSDTPVEMNSDNVLEVLPASESGVVVEEVIPTPTVEPTVVPTAIPTRRPTLAPTKPPSAPTPNKDLNSVPNDVCVQSFCSVGRGKKLGDDCTRIGNAMISTSSIDKMSVCPELFGSF